MDIVKVGVANSRHEARERALQILYAVEIAGHQPETACDELLSGGKKRYLTFARNLVLLAVEHKDEINSLIGKKAKRWDIDRIALLDRLILQLALCELLYMDDVPPKVTINEAIEIAKEYSTDQSGRFVNGILDAVYGDNTDNEQKSKKTALIDDNENTKVHSSSKSNTKSSKSKSRKKPSKSTESIPRES